MQRSPQHSSQYVANREALLEVIDSLTPEERELVCEYGSKALLVIRQYYGRLGEARKVLEEERRALQVKRWENIQVAALRG